MSQLVDFGIILVIGLPRNSLLGIAEQQLLSNT